MTADLARAPLLPDDAANAAPNALLFARYVKALALLCECQPYVDEPDHEEQLEAVLREACAAYGLEMRHAGGRFEIALGAPAAQALAGRAACAS